MAYEAITKQISKVNLIVSLNDFKGKENDKLNELCEWLNLNSKMYGAILHDSDVTADGEKKTPHIHAVFDIPKRKRISTLIGNISDALDCSPLAVTIKSYSSFEGSFQYLTHRNDKDKFQYKASLVRTNLTDDEVSLIYETDTSSLDYERLHKICLEAESLLDVMSVIGLGLYQHYRSAVIDIWRLLHGKDPFVWFGKNDG